MLINIDTNNEIDKIKVYAILNVAKILSYYIYRLNLIFFNKKRPHILPFLYKFRNLNSLLLLLNKQDDGEKSFFVDKHFTIINWSI